MAQYIDYSKIRTSKTDLTDEPEVITYGMNDVTGLLLAIEKYRNEYGNGSVHDIPLTATGISRRELTKHLFEHDPDWCATQCTQMKEIPYELFIQETKTYQGGYVHANRDWVKRKMPYHKPGDPLYTFHSFDYASSYPYCICCFKNAVGPLEEVDPKDYEKVMADNPYDPEYRWIAKIKLYDVESRTRNTYWSYSKAYDCKISKKVKKKNGKEVDALDNGRVVWADEMTIYVDDLSWSTFTRAYSIGHFEVINLYRSKADYLSVEFIKFVLKYFSHKTELKDLEELINDDGTIDGPDIIEAKYKKAKSVLNALYGILVFKFCGLDIFVDDSDENGKIWHKGKEEDLPEIYEKCIKKMKPESTYAQYLCGIYVSSQARFNLWDIILHDDFDENISYCDTDSCKGYYSPDGLEWIKQYNNEVEERQNRVAAELGIDPELFSPKNKDGEIKRLGWLEEEFTDNIECFKTLGAKRYCIQLKKGKKDKKSGKIKKILTTIAGLPKKAGTAVIKTIDDFNNMTEWKPSQSLKKIVYYNDNQPECIWTDYKGVEYTDNNQFGAPIVPTGYDLSMSEEFIKFLLTLNGTVDPDEDEFFSDIPEDFR